MNKYDLEGIRTEIKKDIDAAKALKKAWEEVKFPTKKDGTPFANMSRNIENARYYMDSYVMQPGEYKLSVTTHSELRGYISDEIYCYNQVKYLDDPEMLAKVQNYKPKQHLLEQIYVYDLDDIKRAVKKKIEDFQKDIEILTAQLDTCEAAYREYVKNYGEALKKLEQATNKAEDSRVYCMIRDTVQQRYPYC